MVGMDMVSQRVGFCAARLHNFIDHALLDILTNDYSTCTPEQKVSQS